MRYDYFCKLARILNAQVGSVNVPATNPKKKKKHHFCLHLLMILLGAYRVSGILPGEEMVRAISTVSVIRTNNIPSGKQVRRAR